MIVGSRWRLRRSGGLCSVCARCGVQLAILGFSSTLPLWGFVLVRLERDPPSRSSPVLFVENLDAWSWSVGLLLLRVGSVVCPPFWVFGPDPSLSRCCVWFSSRCLQAPVCFSFYSPLSSLSPKTMKLGGRCIPRSFPLELH